jgi:hypothetical protein
LATIVNLRRIERLEAKTGVGKSWVESLSNAQLDASLLASYTGENFEGFCPPGWIPDEGLCYREVPSDDEISSSLEESLKNMAVRYSNYPDGFIEPRSGLDDVLDVLQELGAPKAATRLVEAVKAERLSATYRWPDWRKGLSEKVLEMLDGASKPGGIVQGKVT